MPNQSGGTGLYMTGIKTLLLPQAYQGANKKAPYFEGWYFKLQAPDGRIFALIPGISNSQTDPHSFIQVIADGVSSYRRYPTDAFKFKPDKLEISVGGSVFTGSGMHIDTDILRGDVRFIDSVPFSHKKYSFGIMGPFALMPFLECRHGVVTVKSGLAGSLEYAGSGKRVCLDDGMGYIEKDWGSVFPDPYVWVHAFLEGGGSFMLSAARVPVLGRELRGLAAFLYAGERIRRFTTYGGAYVDDMAYSADGSLRIETKTPTLKLTLTLKAGGTFGLMAPESTGMHREIRESINGSLQIILETHGGRQLFCDRSQNAAVELSGSIMKLKRR